MDRDLDGAGYAAGVKRVTWPYVISILGGLLILIEGVVVAVVSPFIATEAVSYTHLTLPTTSRV